jgi:hypothetical protein
VFGQYCVRFFGSVVVAERRGLAEGRQQALLGFGEGARALEYEPVQCEELLGGHGLNARMSQACAPSGAKRSAGMRQTVP